MTGGFNRREPKNTARMQQHPQVLEIFIRHQWMGFFKKFTGYDDEVAQEFSHSLNPHSRIDLKFLRYYSLMCLDLPILLSAMDR